jgi:hypothetical protein
MAVLHYPGRVKAGTHLALDRYNRSLNMMGLKFLCTLCAGKYYPLLKSLKQETARAIRLSKNEMIALSVDQAVGAVAFTAA